MAQVLIRAKETSTTVGTGTYTLNGTSFGWLTFVASAGQLSIGLPAAFFYLATDVDLVAESGNWEVGIGTLTDGAPDTLARTTVLASSNGGSAVNWPAGTRNIVAVYPDNAMMIGSNNLSELTNLATARSNLGLGNAAVKDEGSGNLLDADTVDGVHDAAIAHLAGTETISGAKTLSGNNSWTGNNTYSAKNDFSSARLVVPVGSDLWDAV